MTPTPLNIIKYLTAAQLSVNMSKTDPVLQEQNSTSKEKVSCLKDIWKQIARSVLI